MKRPKEVAVHGMEAFHTADQAVTTFATMGRKAPAVVATNPLSTLPLTITINALAMP